MSVPARMHLADALREHLGLTGTHLGCEHGVCGMCTVLVDGDAARACLLFAVQCEGAEIVTVEGLGTPDDQHPLQQAFSAPPRSAVRLLHTRHADELLRPAGR